jgi:hypothetical protein
VDLDGERPGDAPATIKMTNLELEAASPGAWANTLRARVDHNVSEEVAARYGLAKTDLFNLTLHDTATGVTESIVNLTVKESPRRVDRVLATGSGARPQGRGLHADRHGSPGPCRSRSDQECVDRRQCLDEGDRRGQGQRRPRRRRL